ncbi:MAG: AsmA-like C-terminal region-containing protein [Candidatus Zapsychrus exili]|nr:AsmA-like C-terminal region-containing protein [Candidatus Zapsychrus exili]
MTKSLLSTTSIDKLYVSKYLSLLNVKQANVLKNGSISSSEAHISYKDGLVSMTGDLSLNEIDINANEKQKFKGNAKGSNLSLTLLNKELNLSGNVSLISEETFIFPHTYIKGELSLNIDNLYIQQNNGLFKGSIALKNESPGYLIKISDKQEVLGNINIDDASIAWGDKGININGKISTNPTTINISPDIKISGNITSTINSLTFARDKSISLQGNINIDQANIKNGDKQNISSNIALDNASVSVKGSDVQLHGKFNLNNTSISLQDNKTIKGNISTVNTNINFKNKKLDIQSDLKINNTDISLGENKSIKGNVISENTTLSYENKKILLRTLSAFTETEVQFDGINFNGSPNVEFSVAIDPGQETKYSGKVELAEASVSGVPKVGAINNIKGNVLLNENKVETELIEFNTNDVDVKLSGNLENFLNPVIDITASSDEVLLENISKFIPAAKNKAKIKASGKASVTASYKGSIKSTADSLIDATAKLEGVKLSTPKLAEDITNVSGEIRYKNDLITWSGLTGTFKNKDYKISGQLTDISRPTIASRISSEDLTVSTQIKILRKAFQILLLKGNYLNSSFDLLGDVHLTENMGPDLDIKGTLSINLEDLNAIPNELVKSKLAKLKPRGIISFDGLFKGKTKDWRNWDVTFKAQSPKLSLLNYFINNVSIAFSQRDQTVTNFDILSNIYSGDLNISSSADLRDIDIPIKLAADIKGLQLKQLLKSANIKRNMSGNVALSLNLRGPVKNYDKIKDSGSFAISEGYLGRLIPAFKNADFRNARADFLVRNQKVFTENAQIISDTVKVRAEGWVDIKQNIDFNLIPSFSETPVLNTEALKIDPSSILSRALNIKVTGKLTKPRFQVETSPVKILENTTEIIRDGIGSLLEGLF